MTDLKALIVDDEELARRGLTLRLEKCDGIVVCGESRNGREALAHVRELVPDVVFLDIQMPGMDGFEVLKRLAGPDMPIVIFVTAYDRYAIDAFEANALDYLLKPIDDRRLAEAVERAREHAGQRRAAAQRTRLLKLICEITGEDLTLAEALAGRTGPSPYPRRLAIRDGRTTVRVDVADIGWIDAAGDYVCIHVGDDTWVMRGTMKQLEELLDPERFVRVHRSTIVNARGVRAARAHTNGEYFLELDNGHEVKLSRSYRENLTRLDLGSSAQT